MPLHHSSGRIILAICISLSMGSCMKSLPGLTPPPANDTTTQGDPAVTAIGTPIGNPTSKNIDAGGGTILSDDGRLELRFPPGALSASTTITIQPVTNESPNGLGVSYHLMPDGSHFNNPVTMIFHYTNHDANGSIPYLFYVAYQDADQKWKADLKKRSVDTVAKTVTTTITHFSIWSLGAEIVMIASPFSVYENQTSAVTVNRIIAVTRSFPGAPGEDDLPPLTKSEELPDGAVSAWKVNGVTGGNQTDGFISGSGNSASFTAPAVIDTKRDVQVSSEVNYSVVYFNNGNAGQSLNKFIVFVDITLLPSEFDFTVNTDYKELLPVIGNLMYEDKATFDLSLKTFKNPDGTTTIIAVGSGYKNQIPTCNPCTANYADGSSWTCVPGSIGLTNITDVSLLNYIGDTVILNFIHTGPQSWGAHAVDAKGEVGDAAPIPTPFGIGLPNQAKIALKNEMQVYSDPVNPDLTVTFTPK